MVQPSPQARHSKLNHRPVQTGLFVEEPSVGAIWPACSVWLAQVVFHDPFSALASRSWARKTIFSTLP